MKVLITGGSSLLGKYLVQSCPEDMEIQATWHQNYTGWCEGWTAKRLYRMDTTSKADVDLVFSRTQPKMVIHCAAHGSVDYAENNYQEVHNVNVGGTKHVIDAANSYRAKLIYISTNAVYRGDEPPYSETSPLEPVNAYGVIKKQAEKLVQDMSREWVIIRPFMLYGWPFPGGRANWGKSIIEDLRQGESIELVSDIYWQPTFALCVAQAIWHLSQCDREIYNVASCNSVSLYEFGRLVADVFELDASLISPVSYEKFNNMAKRPVDTGYDLTKLDEIYGTLGSLEAGLRKMKDSEKAKENV